MTLLPPLRCQTSCTEGGSHKLKTKLKPTTFTLTFIPQPFMYSSVLHERCNRLRSQTTLKFISRLQQFNNSQAPLTVFHSHESKKAEPHLQCPNPVCTTSKAWYDGFTTPYHSYHPVSHTPPRVPIPTHPLCLL